ncbi:MULTISPECIES: hypothetical protein [Agrobacterium]|nr:MULTISPECIES: hypothetical protein [Agrobacterium]
MTADLLTRFNDNAMCFLFTLHDGEPDFEKPGATSSVSGKETPSGAADAE